jgi:Methyl-accepting chemotaxis protein
MKSIKSKLLLSFGLLIGIICIGLSAVSYLNASNSLESNLKKTLGKIAEVTASNIDGRVEGQLNVLDTIAEIESIADPNNTWENKKAILLQEVKRLGSKKICLIEKDGISKNTDGTSSNYADREYFKKAIAGERNVSDPIISKTDGTVVIAYAVPVKYNDKIVAVLSEIRDGNRLSEITKEVKFGQTGNAFMINETATMIADSVEGSERVINMYNVVDEAKKDAKLQQLADVEKKMTVGEAGTGKYTYDGAEKYIGYAPVKGTTWSVGVNIQQSEILSELDNLMKYSVIVSIVFLVLGFAIIFIIARKIASSIGTTSKHLNILASGDLTKAVDKKNLKLKDEIGDMTNSLNLMQESLRDMVNRIKKSSANINLQSESLSSVSEQMSASSQNVAEAISDVAKGTGEQAEDLVNSINILDIFSNKLTEMVSEIINIDSNARQITVMAEESSSDMTELNESVTNISNSFKIFNGKIVGLGKDVNEINNITNMINSIADQTNLLALNAAIEAARAGESGRGFAVVADEIRKLAEQSKVSSENISRLIVGISKNTNVIVEDSVTMDEELLNQINTINNSIVSFKNIIKAINDVIPKIQTVKYTAESIDTDKNEIMHRMEGVSAVSTEVSASAEEISAAAEQMNASTQEVSASAQVLSSTTKDMLEEIGKFKV